MRANCTIILFDVATVQDEATGDRTKVLVKTIKMNGEKGQVSMNSFWGAAAINVQLDHSLLIRGRMYQAQKYAYLEQNLYEVYNTTRTDDPSYIRLNVRRINDSELRELIIDAMGLIQTP